ncbi:MAG: zinc-ribbon domain-containing protein [Oscillospiraceae bacterium]
MSKFCLNCGSQMNDDETFCRNCGASQNVQGGYNQSVQPNGPQAQQQYYQQPAMPVQQVTGMGGWIGWLLLASFLPLIGTIIALCCSNDQSVKNWAKANLIITAIILVLVIILCVVFAGATYAMLDY